jgi:hypothetical protein
VSQKQLTQQLTKRPFFPPCPSFCLDNLDGLHALTVHFIGCERSTVATASSAAAVELEGLLGPGEGLQLLQKAVNVFIQGRDLSHWGSRLVDLGFWTFLLRSPDSRRHNDRVTVWSLGQQTQ